MRLRACICVCTVATDTYVCGCAHAHVCTHVCTHICMHICTPLHIMHACTMARVHSFPFPIKNTTLGHLVTTSYAVAKAGEPALRRASLGSLRPSLGSHKRSILECRQDLPGSRSPIPIFLCILQLFHLILLHRSDGIQVPDLEYSRGALALRYLVR